MLQSVTARLDRLVVSMRPVVRHRLAEALRWVERKSDKWARRLEPEVYRVWRVRPPEGADPLGTTVITVRGRGDGTFIFTSGTARQEPPTFTVPATPPPDD